MASNFIENKGKDPFSIEDRLLKKPGLGKRIKLGLKRREKVEGKFEVLLYGSPSLSREAILEFFKERVRTCILEKQFKELEERLEKEMEGATFTVFGFTPSKVSLSFSEAKNVFLFMIAKKWTYINETSGKKEKNTVLRFFVSLFYLEGKTSYLPLLDISERVDNEKIRPGQLEEMLKLYNFMLKNNLVHVDMECQEKLYKLEIDLNEALSKAPPEPTNVIVKSF